MYKSPWRADMLEPPCMAPSCSQRSQFLSACILPILMFGQTKTKTQLFATCMMIYTLSCSLRFAVRRCRCKRPRNLNQKRTQTRPKAVGTICPSDVAGREIWNIRSLCGKQRPPYGVPPYLPLSTGLSDPDSPQSEQILTYIYIWLHFI